MMRRLVLQLAVATFLVFGDDVTTTHNQEESGLGGGGPGALDYAEEDGTVTNVTNNNNNNNNEANPTSSLVFTKMLENMTVDSGKTIRLVCEVQQQNVEASNNNGSDLGRINVAWHKNYVPVEKSKRIVVKTNRLKTEHKVRSTLRITNVDIFDKGFYDCVATLTPGGANSNHNSRIKSEALLDVSADATRWGSTATATFNTMRFDSNNEMTSQASPSPSSSASSGAASEIFDARLPVSHLDHVLQKSKTKTFDLIPSHGDLDEDDLDGNNEQERENMGAKQTKFYNPNEPFCQIYTGSKCKDFLDNKYVFVQPPFSQQEIEQKLTDTFVVVSQSNDISRSCNKFARPSLCFSAFPLCTDPHKINTDQYKKHYRNADSLRNIRNDLGDSLKRICKDDCLLLENELCSKEYAIAKRHPVIGKALELEQCQFIPVETNYTLDNCLSLGVDDESVNRDDNCYWDNGEAYRGVQEHSENGNKCLRWSHQFHVHLSEHPELTGHNYCRNPGGLAPGPFCYIDQHKKEMCHITKCAHVIGMYLIATFVAIAMVTTVVVGLFCCRKRNKKRSNLQNMNLPPVNKNIYGNPGPNSPMEMNNLLPPNIPPQHRHHHPAGSKGNYQNVPQYTYKEVSFVEELGEGAFGKVYKGELRTKSSGKIYVAVKSLKENASAKTQADFQREIELISELKHPNIICLMGVVVKQEPMCMLFEFMSEGDLHEFLIANSPSEGKSLTQNQFLHVAIQIAQGMEYLSENHYVHRDLAARNCLVSKDLVVKISDFGLSRDMYSCDYYRVQSKSLLPVRWMPPESILYGKFTTESDIWSYGVVLWEIYSYGLQPYYGYNNQEVINMIRSRKLLPCPDACPSYCYSLMVECWAELSIRRPSFGEIVHRLRVWKQNGNSGGATYYKLNEPQQQHRVPSRSLADSSTTTTAESPEVVPSEHEVWGRPLTKPCRGEPRLHDSQSSLTSRSSSLGGRTQSTNLSGEMSKRRSHNNRSRNGGEMELGAAAPKNTVVNSNGDNFEIKITTR